MKKFAHLCISSLVLFVFNHSAGAQSYFKPSLFKINYSLSTPSGNLVDFTDDFSFRGISAEYSYFFNEQFGIGGRAGFNHFFEESNGVTSEQIQIGSSTLTVSGNQFRNFTVVPVMFKATYLHTNSTLFTPYASVGLGGIHAERSIEMGKYLIEDSGWGFGFAPEVGILIDLNDILLTLSGAFNSSTGNEVIDSYAFYTLDLGLAWRFN